MEEKRILEIEILGENEEEIFFKIKKQTHRNKNFSRNGNSFKASNGITLDSSLSPGSELMHKRICVRGIHTFYDDFIIRIPKVYLQDVEKAIKEYNIRSNIPSRDEKTKIREAIKTVLYLAEDNILPEEYYCGIKRLEEEREKHVSAIETVKKAFNIKK